MKNTIKAIAFAVLGAAAAHATLITPNANQVYITGSTGFRGSVNAYLYTQYSNNLAVWDQNTNTIAAAASAKMLAFTNVPIGSTTCDIILSWIGSEAGMQNVMAPSGLTNKKQVFYNLAAISNSASASGGTNWLNKYADDGNLGKGGTPTTAYCIGTNAQITFADNTQTASAFHGNTASPDGVTYNSVGTNASPGCYGQVVAVIPFQFFIQNGAKYTNLTASAWYDLATVGYITGNELTGVASDSNDVIIMTGRNIDSGTRVNMQVATHIPTSVSLKQLAPNNASSTATSFSFELPATINGISMGLGNNGEGSGGTLAQWLTNAAPSVTSVTSWPFSLPKTGTGHVYMASYIANGDAVAKFKAGTAGVRPMLYNGIAGRCFTTNPSLDFLNSQVNGALVDPVDGSSVNGIGYTDAGFTNVINGAFPYWGYETAYYNTNWASTAAAGGCATNLFTQIIGNFTNNVTGNSTNEFMFGAINLNDMAVYRTKDGGPVLINTNPATCLPTP